MSAGDDLTDVFAWREERTVSSSLTLQYDKVLFLLEPNEITRQLHRQRVTVVDYPDGRLAIRYRGLDLPYTTFDKLRQVAQGAPTGSAEGGTLPRTARGTIGSSSMPEMEAKDVDELFARRMTDRVVELAEQQVKRRYLWVNLTGALAFVVLSWFGGTALLSTLVKDRVDAEVAAQKKQIEEAAIDAAAKNADTKAKLALIQETLENAKGDEKKLSEQITFLKDQTKSIQDNVNELTSATNTLHKLSADIDVLKGNVKDLATLSETVSDIQVALKGAAQTSPALATAVKTLGEKSTADQIGSRLATASKRLNLGTVFLQFSGAVTRDEIRRVSTELQKSQEFLIPPEERVPGSTREVRYFFPTDKELADKVAAATEQVLKNQGFGNITVTAVSYEDYPKLKPPKGTVELWLGALPSPGSH